MMEEKYVINQHFMWMVGVFDHRAKVCSLVGQEDKSFFVDQSPLEILDGSLALIGFDLKGAMKASKSHLKNVHMCPIMVNPTLNICLFPSHSPRREDTMWFNPLQIHRTFSKDNKTSIEFENGTQMTINSRITSFNNKLKIAEQYLKTKVAAARDPLTYLVDPKNRKVLC
ncbi:competence protein ComK [Bacillus sp. BRMEA1]|uniref:competence protein ComK n=1 Tax=Neobacillus endophyticus TaxID=2738405 RepID=UPI001563BA45|nr:competence protein ComK [Neobacillus endophyticus]NRD76936.1 competence protein ComK [Neobacillus endophyticus]